jgi:hypothetical protein
LSSSIPKARNEVRIKRLGDKICKIPGDKTMAGASEEQGVKIQTSYKQACAVPARSMCSKAMCITATRS